MKVNKEDSILIPEEYPEEINWQERAEIAEARVKELEALVESVNTSRIIESSSLQYNMSERTKAEDRIRELEEETERWNKSYTYNAHRLYSNVKVLEEQLRWSDDKIKSLEAELEQIKEAYVDGKLLEDRNYLLKRVNELEAYMESNGKRIVKLVGEVMQNNEVIMQIKQ